MLAAFPNSQARDHFFRTTTEGNAPFVPKNCLSRPSHRTSRDHVAHARGADQPGGGLSTTSTSGRLNCVGRAALMLSTAHVRAVDVGSFVHRNAVGVAKNRPRSRVRVVPPGLQDSSQLERGRSSSDSLGVAVPSRALRMDVTRWRTGRRDRRSLDGISAEACPTCNGPPKARCVVRSGARRSHGHRGRAQVASAQQPMP